MLERHQLKIPRVALDKDGSIAEKYQAHAIPQTVIIGRDGNVARLFGGGPRFGDQLREAIKATLAGEKPQGAGKPEWGHGPRPISPEVPRTKPRPGTNASIEANEPGGPGVLPR